MRRVIVAAFLVAAVAAALPWALGRYLQYRHGLLLHDLATRGYRIPVDDYRLGWLRSTTRTEIAPQATADAEEQSRLGLTLSLRHGPTVWLHAWPPLLATATGRVRVLGGPRALPPVNLAARLQAAGALHLSLRVPDITYSGAAGRLSIASGDADLRLAPDGTWELDGHLDSLEATAPDGRRLRLQDIVWALAGADAHAALPLSRLRLAMGALHLDAATTAPAVDIGAFEASLTASSAAATTRVALSGTLEALSVGQDAYAPSALKLAVGGIDSAALRDLRARLLGLDRGALSASQQGVITAQLLLAALPRLLSGTPEAEVRRLLVTTPYGPIAATAELRMAPAEAPARRGTVSGSPQPEKSPLLPGLWARLSGSLRLAAPQSLVVALLAEQQTRRVRRELALRGEPAQALPPELAADVEAAAQAAAGALLREGWLKPEQGRLVADLRLADGSLRVNGKTLGLPDRLATPERP